MYSEPTDPKREVRINARIRRLGEALRDAIQRSPEIARLMNELARDGVGVSFNFCSVSSEGLLDLTVDPTRDVCLDSHAESNLAESTEADDEWTPEDREFLRKLEKHLP